MKKPKTQRRTTAPQRQGAFRLPPGVSFQKKLLASGWAYVFRHTTLGQLERIVLEDHPDGRAQVTCEIAGDPADPMTAQRKALFEPVAMDLGRRLETQTGSVGGENVRRYLLQRRHLAAYQVVYWYNGGPRRVTAEGFLALYEAGRLPCPSPRGKRSALLSPRKIFGKKNLPLTV